MFFHLVFFRFDLIFPPQMMEKFFLFVNIYEYLIS